MAEFTIKPLRVSDINESTVTSINTLLHQLTPRAKDLDIAKLNDIVSQSQTHCFVALNDQNAIFGMFIVTIAQLGLGKVLYFEESVVDETHRGMGIGKALLEHAIEFAKANGVTEIDLTSNPSRTAAISLYERHGFEKRVTNVYRLKL